VRFDSNTLSNVAFTMACATIVVLGGLRIKDRVTAAPSAASRPAPPSPVVDMSPVNVPIADAPRQGDKSAKIAVIEFSDFECPFCGKYAQSAYQDVKREFVASGKIQYAFVNLPLPRHPHAQAAAEAAECAHAEDRFWPLHDRLFAKQDLLAPADLVNHAKEIGMEAASVETCLGGKFRSMVTSDVELAKRVGVQSTPTFLIGIVNPDGSVRVTKKITGAQPADVFRNALKGMIAG
jgi:protein-disulfide isomerase